MKLIINNAILIRKDKLRFNISVFEGWVMNKKFLTNTILISLAVIFVVSLVFVVVLNNRTQTNNFWNSQKDSLAIITEKCVIEISDWTNLQERIVITIAAEVENGNFVAASDYESFLARAVKNNPEVQAAYVALNNGTNYFHDPTIIPDDDDADFFEWYYACINANGKVFLPNPI